MNTDEMVQIEKKKEILLSFRVSKEQSIELDRLCEELNISVANMLRIALREFIKRQHKKKVNKNV